LLVIPSFLLLFSLHGRQLLESENLQEKADETGAGR
jgi:hypothetical protein